MILLETIPDSLRNPPSGAVGGITWIRVILCRLDLNDPPASAGGIYLAREDAVSKRSLVASTISSMMRGKS